MPVQISPVQRNILIEEVLVQANLALEAYSRLRGLVANLETRQRRECWAHVHSLLAHTAMISKFMKPVSNSEVSQARAKTLKNTLNVDDASPIFSRNARNNTEHLDERIDAWINTGPERVLETVFDNRDAFDFLYRHDTVDPRRWFVKRVYLIAEGIFMSEGKAGVEEVNIEALRFEIFQIQKAAQEFLAEDTVVVRLG